MAAGQDKSHGGKARGVPVQSLAQGGGQLPGPIVIEQLKELVGVSDLKSLDPEKLRAGSEELIVVLQSAAPKIGLRSPSLEEIAE